MMLGAVVIAAGYIFVALRTDSITDIVIASGIIGAAGISTAATAQLITDAVPATDTASANGVNTLMRQVGIATSTAVLTVVLAHTTISLGSATLPSEEGFRTTFIVGAAAAIVGLLLTALIPTRTPVSGGSAEQYSKPADAPAGDAIPQR
ncbi:hypothetical protein ACFQ0G_02495 [Streptomyces chiangmaiensis]